MINQQLVTFLSCALLALFCFGTPSYAQDIQCPRHNIKTSLKGKLAKTRIFRGSTNAFSEYVFGHDRGGRILGLVNYAELQTKLKYNFDVIEVGNAQYCVVLKQVNGFFYAAPKLFMPKEYAKKSCEYQQILKHEKRHLNAVYDFHKRNTGKYAAYLGKIAREVPIPAPVSSQKEAEQVKREIAAYFENEFKELEYQSIAQLNREQAKIDSPQEYLGVSKRCSNW